MDVFAYIYDLFVDTSDEGDVPTNPDNGTSGNGGNGCVIAWNAPFLIGLLRLSYHHRKSLCWIKIIYWWISSVSQKHIQPALPLSLSAHAHASTFRHHHIAYFGIAFSYSWHIIDTLHFSASQNYQLPPSHYLFSYYTIPFLRFGKIQLVATFDFQM